MYASELPFTAMDVNVHPTGEPLSAHLAEMANAPDEPTRSDLDRLRVEVWVVVDAMKAAGEPPERVLAFVKRAVADAGLKHHRESVARAVVSWCSERHYTSDNPVA